HRMSCDVAALAMQLQLLHAFWELRPSRRKPRIDFVFANRRGFRIWRFARRVLLDVIELPLRALCLRLIDGLCSRRRRGRLLRHRSRHEDHETEQGSAHRETPVTKPVE